MEELVKSLIQQVQLLKESVEAMLTRQEQVFRMHDEQLNALTSNMAEQSKLLQQVTEEIQITDEALKSSLSESDQGIDDLSKATAALILLQQRMQQQQSGESAS